MNIHDTETKEPDNNRFQNMKTRVVMAKVEELQAKSVETVFNSKEKQSNILKLKVKENKPSSKYWRALPNEFYSR